MNQKLVDSLITIVRAGKARSLRDRFLKKNVKYLNKNYSLTIIQLAHKIL